MKLTTKENDILVGDMNEDLIRQYFLDEDVVLLKTDNYHPMDFIDIDNNQFIEIKSRTFNSSKYPTTMIGENKIIFARQCGKKCKFIFVFTDKTLYYDFNPKDSFITEYCGRKDRGCIEYKKHIFIPIEKLKIF